MSASTSFAYNVESQILSFHICFYTFLYQCIFSAQSDEENEAQEVASDGEANEGSDDNQQQSDDEGQHHSDAEEQHESDAEVGVGEARSDEEVNM